MKKFVAIFLALAFLVSFIPAQSVGNDKVIVAYVIVYANKQSELQQKVQRFLDMRAGWQLWGTIVLTQGYNTYVEGCLSQVLVQYK